MTMRVATRSREKWQVLVIWLWCSHWDLLRDCTLTVWSEQLGNGLVVFSVGKIEEQAFLEGVAMRWNQD